MAEAAHASETADAQWKPLPRRRTHELIVEQIEDRLRQGTLRAGDRLPPERMLAEALGVSRGAVREALRILEAIGVIEAAPGSGPSAGSVIVHRGADAMAMVLRLHLRMASFSPQDSADVAASLETLAVAGACRRATTEDVATLRSLVEQMRTAGSLADRLDLDTVLLQRITEMSGNVLASAVLSGLRQARFDMPNPSVEARGALVDAIAAGDEARAVALVAHRAAGEDDPDLTRLRPAG
ncbi:FadR/GntR family transcriptional regulator [Mycobacterium sp. NPDC003449]